MTAADREAPHHDSLTCIKDYNCKRTACVARSLAYDRRRYRQIGYGTWEPLVDAAPARNHIGELRQLGHSLPDIEKAARISPATLSRILYSGVNKRARRIRPEVSERILSIPLTPPPVKPHTIVDATTTRRRLQALVSMGWTLKALGPQLGFHPRRLTDLLHADQVLASTARRVAEAYRTVQTRDPRDHGVSERSIAISRNLAAREGWHGPLAWDDIDDPKATPEEHPAYRSVAKNGRDSMRMAEVEHLYLLGESPASIAKKFDGNEKYVRDLIGAVIRRRETRAKQERAAARARQTEAVAA